MNEKALLSAWDFAYASSGDSALITGSPNRTENRFLFQDDSGSFYVAEGYNKAKMEAQKRQNILLETFAENHLEGIYPFCRTLSGEHGTIYGDLFWQIRPYIAADAMVEQRDFGSKGDFGKLWGEFLLQMKEIFVRLPEKPAMPNAPFYMSGYMPKLFTLAERKMPSILEKLRHFENLLAPFFKWERSVQQMFAHGDYHPGNILMGEGKIKTVIDWEFTGMKFPGYDMALLIGCLGMDHPDNLASEAVVVLQDILYENHFMEEDAWEHLTEMISSTRMGWLGEWLSMGDENLVKQEMELLSILLE